MAKMAPTSEAGTSAPAEDSRIAILTLLQPLKEKKTDIWILSTACNGHIANNIKWFQDFTKFMIPRKVKGISSKPIFAWGSGTVHLPALNPAGICQMKLQNVWFMPIASCNMLSMCQLEEHCAVYNGLTSSLTCMKTGLIIASIEIWNGSKTIKLDIEAILKLKLKIKSKDNNDNQIDISEFFECLESFLKPFKSTEPIELVDPAESFDSADSVDLP